MPSVGVGDVSVSGSATPADPLIIELIGALKETNVAAPTVNTANLTGGAGKVTVTTVQDGTGAVSDTFTDTEGTQWQNHTTDSGHVWTVNNQVGSAGFIRSNELDPGQFNLATVDKTATDASGSIELRYTTIDTANKDNEFGFLFRYQDASNYWKVVVSWNGSTGTKELRLVKVIAGVPTTVDSTTLNLTQGTDYTLTASVSGNDWSGSIDDDSGTQSVSGTDTALNTEDDHGLFVDKHSNTGMRVDDLVMGIGAASNEQQEVYTNGQGGSFTLKRPETGDSTAAISPTASAATVKSRLEGIYGTGNVSTVTGTGTPASPWRVTWGGALAGLNLQQMEGDGSQLTGVISATVTTLQDGAPGKDTIWDVFIHNTTSGNFTFEFLGRPTANIAYGATAATVLTALQNLSPS